MKRTELMGGGIDVQPLPDGSCVLILQTPAGEPTPFTEIVVMTLPEPVARDIGSKLLAPRVAVASEMPSNGERVRG